MVAIASTELSVTLVVDRVQVRLVQLLLSGKPMSECVAQLTKECNWPGMTADDGRVLAKQFALSLQPVIGLIEPPSVMDLFQPTEKTLTN